MSEWMLDIWLCCMSERAFADFLGFLLLCFFLERALLKLVGVS